jgi:hypothetical protein
MPGCCGHLAARAVSPILGEWDKLTTTGAAKEPTRRVGGHGPQNPGQEAADKLGTGAWGKGAWVF